MFCEKTVYSQASVVNSTLTECTIPASEVSCNNKIGIREVSMNNVELLLYFQLSCDISNASIGVFLERSDSYIIDTPSIASVEGGCLCRIYPVVVYLLGCFMFSPFLKFEIS